MDSILPAAGGMLPVSLTLGGNTLIHPRSKMDEPEEWGVFFNEKRVNMDKHILVHTQKTVFPSIQVYGRKRNKEK